MLGVVEGDAIRMRSDYDRELLSAYKQGQEVRVDITRIRSRPLNSFYWVLLRLVCENSAYENEEFLHDALLFELRITKPVITPGGDIYLAPKSTAFDAMGDDEFRPYFNKVKDIIAHQIIPGVDIDEMVKEAARRSGYDLKKLNEPEQIKEAA
jgi:hypothetical protein